MTRKKNRAAVSLGRRGGKSTSDAKAAAARENGRKGGRPPTVARLLSEADRIIEEASAIAAELLKAGGR